MQKKHIQGVSKKHNTFDHEYLKDGSSKFIVLLVCYLVLPYNSIVITTRAMTRRLELGPSKSIKFENNVQSNLLHTIY